MKRFLMLMLVVAMLFAGCAREADNKNNDTTNKDEKVQTEESKENGKNTDKESVTTNFGSADELEEIVFADVDKTIGALRTECDELIAKIDTYEKYKDNVVEVETFYTKVQSETESLCIRLREYAGAYSETVINSGNSFDEKYDEIEWIYDCLYNDACDEIYDEIYDGIMEDMYDAFYDGVIDEGYDDDSYSYSDVSDLSSNEYEMYSDTSSEVYELYSDTQSDIYSLYSELQSEFYGEDIEKAREELDDFKEDIKKLKDK